MLGIAVSALGVACGVVFLLARPDPVESHITGKSVPASPSEDLPVAPLAGGPLDLTVLYLDPPAGSASAAADARGQALSGALAAVMERRPRAVMLASAPPKGLSTTAAAGLSAALAHRSPAGEPPVLALSPAPAEEGAGEAPLSWNAVLPGCAAGPSRGAGCVDLELPAPAGPGELTQLDRCAGTTPYASLALALLARDGAAALANRGAALSDACREGASLLARAPPDDPCQGPYHWLWASEVATGPIGPPRDPLGGLRGTTVCPGWGEIANRVVVLEDPSNGGAPVRLRAREETGQNKTLKAAPAEALAIEAWSLLGWMEEDRP